MYLICALLTPLTVKLYQRIKIRYLFLLLFTLFLLHELLVYFGLNEFDLVLKYILAYTIPYGTIYILGLISKKTQFKYYDFVMSGMFLAIFILMIVANVLTGKGIATIQSAKYPPTLYFVSYSLVISFFALGLLKRIKLNKNKLVSFFSKSSLWIYLWHILILFIFSNFF